MPPNHQKYGTWNGDRFRNWAAKVGPSCKSVIEYFLSVAKVEQQAYKTCNALLHLADRNSSARLETACARVLQFTLRPSYKAVNSVLKSGQDTLIDKASREGTDAHTEHSFIRGAEYYGGGDDDVE